MTSDLSEHLIALEKSLHDPAVRSDKCMLEKLLDSDFFEYGTSGKIWTREMTLEELTEKPQAIIHSFDYNVRELTSSLCQVTYKTRRESFDVLRSSLWRRHNDEWKMIFHQGTKAL